MSNLKKDFQKTISAIRKDRKESTGRDVHYPKAMMTGQQESKRTATVNCGGEWVSEQVSVEIAELVMKDHRFNDFLARYSAKAITEKNPFGGVQVRIHY